MKRYIRSAEIKKYKAKPKNNRNGAVWLVDPDVIKNISKYQHQIPAVSEDGKFETIIDERNYDFYK
ncbi:hypothetical protein [Ruminococcus sp.]|uniref:hypothetical protein n=1 Tax=Ruminococcus sp. TaxID=41978 RepID=UPI001B3E39CE|nr:hypothetical protein [Ruminococcus sp.]MBP5433707.1 hypothetical protein [Ruminococcus sp.]